jgi:hypothetical protein
MTPIMFFGLLASLLSGLVLIVIARRGRRLNDHPVCGSCRFDLSGIHPNSSTCPECGAGLSRRNGIRIGVRRRMPLVGVLGLLLLVVAALPLGAVLYAAATGGNINAYKPLALMLWEAPRVGATESDRIALEIDRRLSAKTIPTSAMPEILEAALRAQANCSAKWSEVWGDIVERERLGGALDADVVQDFFNSAAVMKLEVRPKVHVGGSVPVFVKLTDNRAGSLSSYTVLVRPRKAALDVTDLSIRVVADPREKLLMAGTREQAAFPPDQRFLPVAGTRAPARAMVGSPFVSWSCSLPPSIEPGRYNFSIELDVHADLRNMNPMATGGPEVKEASSVVKKIKLVAPVEVVARDVPIVKPTTADAATDEKLRSMFSQCAISISRLSYPSGSYVTVSAMLPSGPFPAGLAHDVIVHANRREVRVGTVVSEPFASEPMSLAFMRSMGFRHGGSGR